MREQRVVSFAAERRPPPDTAVVGRAEVYGLLSVLLAGPPSAEVLQRLRGIDQCGAHEEGSMAEACRGLGKAARETSPGRVEREYHDVFIGLTEGEVVPYGSWYLTGSLMDRPLVRLRADLARLGFQRRTDMHDPEDHAAALCEVAGLLIADSHDGDEVEAARFFRAHLYTWMPRFFADLQRCASARFYAAVGRLGAEFLALERTYFALPSAVGEFRERVQS